MNFFCLLPKLLCFLLLNLLLLFPFPTLAANATQPRIFLTLQLLEEKINSPVQIEGINTIDLRNLIIDLTNENAAFRDEFYQLLQSKINRPNIPIGLDFSDSLIQGEFNASRLGVTAAATKEGLAAILTPIEETKIQIYQKHLIVRGEQFVFLTILRGTIKLDRAILTGQVNFANTFLFQRVEAIGTTFTQEVNWSNSNFSRLADFTKATFGRDVNFSGSSFFGKTQFIQAQFQGRANFSHSYFDLDVDFTDAKFTHLADFTEIQWNNVADFSQITWNDRALFSKNIFRNVVSFANNTFEQSAAFRDTYFNGFINFEGVEILEQVDFSNDLFTKNAYLNVADLAFESNKAKILGDTGIIGQIISVPVLEGNENVLRNLVRNFRDLEQIPDANQIEYEAKKLRFYQLKSQIISSSIQNIFRLSWLGDLLNWFGLSLLLLLSQYGTNFSLVLSVGVVAIAYFGLIFWFVDRYRRKLPQPIVPTLYESICIVSSYLILTAISTIAIFQTAPKPWLTLACLAIILLPLPLLLLFRLYRQGRYHDLMDVSYFVEDGEKRQFRLLIVRLPNIPRYPFYRERYLPILWDRRWNFINYYDFSLNNLLKFGFNDIRLRDQHLPGIINTLVWYEWTLGLLYITLLFWTLSRTIPGLNLLIYL